MFLWPEENFADTGVSAKKWPWVFADARVVTKVVVDVKHVSGENASLNAHGLYGAILLILYIVHQLNGSCLVGFHYTEICQGVFFPRTTVSGGVPLGRSPNAVI